MNLLRRAGSPFADIAALRRFRKGERGSTFPWANTATALHNLVGPCWLANEIAVIGAASKRKNGWTKVSGVEPFGPQGHPTALMAGARDHAGDAGWWRAGRGTATDDLSRAVWALALWALAPRAVFDREADEWARIVGELPASRARALSSAARNLQPWRDGSVGLVPHRSWLSRPRRACRPRRPNQSASWRVPSLRAWRRWRAVRSGSRSTPRSSTGNRAGIAHLRGDRRGTGGALAAAPPPPPPPTSAARCGGAVADEARYALDR